MKVHEKTGRFVKISEKFKLTDEAGNPVESIEAGVTVVHGSFRLMTKDQIARVTGIVTESMTNGRNEKNQRIYEFQGNDWRPQALIGDILLQDIDNPFDRWACGPELFGGTGWTGTVNYHDMSVTYTKAGEPLLVVKLPNRMMVKSREGTRFAPEGSLLAVTKADKGDFHIWTPEVVAKYVRDYVE